MWRIAAPMILSNISIPLVGITDTVITGHRDKRPQECPKKYHAIYP